MNNVLITVIGPTAIGKTALSVSLAKFFHTEIISSDSRQFYREMEIGTAVPTLEEQQGIPHHFIQHLSVTSSYSVGTFEREALQKINTLFEVHDRIIMVGGSALYTNAVLKGLDEFPKIKPGIREELKTKYKEEGIGPLQNLLEELDPLYYEQVDLHNPHRLIRALEVCLSSGKPYSSFLDQPKKPRPFRAMLIGLTAERAALYERIDTRVDKMMENGLLNEVKHLLPFKEHNALQTVGYQELFAYLDGACSLDFAVSEIKKNTRRFAKRQLTWYRKNPDIQWFDYQTPHREIANVIEQQLHQ